LGRSSPEEQIATVANYCLASFPLLVDSTPVGAFTVASTQQGMLGDEELDLLQEMVANLSFALQYLHKDNALRYLSYFDPLTDLANRTLFCERVARLMGPLRTLLRKPLLPLSTCSGLSLINDSFGRHIGDLLLQCAADRLRQRFDAANVWLIWAVVRLRLFFPTTRHHRLRRIRLPTPLLARSPSKARDPGSRQNVGSLAFLRMGPPRKHWWQNAEVALHAAHADGASHRYYRKK